MMVFTAPAVAQTAKIAVVDVQLLMNESVAAKNIQAQIDKKREAYQKDFTKAEQDLLAQEKDLMARGESLSEEDFVRKRDAFEDKVMEARAMVQGKQRALESAVDEALSKMREEVSTIVSAISEEKGYDLVLTTQNVISVRSDMDITDIVMKALDAKLQEVTLKVAQ